MKIYMKKVCLLLSVSIFLMLFFQSNAFSSDITQQLKRVDVYFNKGDMARASKELRAILVKVYNKSKLTIDRAVLIDKNPKGFGMISIRKNNIFKPNETIGIYVEPVGYHFLKKGNNYSFGFYADFAVQDENGAILGGKTNFGSWNYTIKGRPLFDFYILLTYNFHGIKPGKYIIITTIHDKYGHNSTTLKTPVVIVK